jgi:hypothetical protein
VESPDTSTFLKHFYLKLLRDFFQDAVFAKPTGDGLLIIYRHSEQNLNQVSALVLSKCFEAIDAFPKMFESVPIINYAPPNAIGFGIARGSASYLIAGRDTLDYSGKVLNLAARLNELARPTGIVIDGSYQQSIIPEPMRGRFNQKRVYLRGIAETESILVFSSKQVSIPSEASHPLAGHTWMLAEQERTAGEVLQFTGSFSVPIPEPASRGLVRAEYRWPGKVKDTTAWRLCESFTVNIDATGYKVWFPTEEARGIIKDEGIAADSGFIFRVHYVPKPVPQKVTSGSRRLKKA